MKKVLQKRYDLPVVQNAGDSVRDTFELDKGTERVVGLLLTSDYDSHIYHRGTLSVHLSGEEIHAEGYHAKLLMSGLGVPPARRFIPLNLPPGNCQLKIAYQDAEHPSAPFTPYRVSVYVKTRIDLP